MKVKGKIKVIKPASQTVQTAEIGSDSLLAQETLSEVRQTVAMTVQGWVEDYQKRKDERYRNALALKGG